MPATSSSAPLRPELVKLTGEVTDVRISTEVAYTRYSTSHYGTRVTPQSKQVGAITVRVSGQPITCLIAMFTRFIGVMAGNTVTVWGRVRKWETDSDLPQSIDVERLEIDETGEVHPQGGGVNAQIFMVLIPIIFVIVMFVFLFFFVLGPLGLGSFSFFPIFPIMIIFVVGFSLVAMIPIIMAAVNRSRRLSASDLAGYVEVPGYASEGAKGIEKEFPEPAGKTCSNCGAAIKDGRASYCWNCGARLSLDSTAPKGARRCIVCNLAIKKSDASVHCPYCGNSAHRIHMLEWLHTHDYCPVCRKHLEEQSF